MRLSLKDLRLELPPMLALAGPVVLAEVGWIWNHQGASCP
jgi:hypothetical protein